MTNATETLSTEQRRENVWAAVRRIPAGCVMTYGQVADLAGLPRGARFVGWALRQLDAQTDVPWHRVVGSPGKIAFARDSHAYQRQCDRLADEGVRVERGRIDLKSHGWHDALDQMLWGEPPPMNEGEPPPMNEGEPPPMSEGEME